MGFIVGRIIKVTTLDRAKGDDLSSYLMQRIVEEESIYTNTGVLTD